MQQADLRQEQTAHMGHFKRCTIVDVARQAGVSRSTAGHILRNTSSLAGRFSEATRARVLRCAQQLGYTPHLMAAGLRTGKSNLLALVVEGPWMDDSSRVANDIKAAQWSLVAALVQRARERGRKPLMDILEHHTASEDMQIIHSLTASGMGGILIKSPHPGANPLLHSLAQERFPIVALFPQSRKSLRYNWVDTDNVRAGRMAATHLLASGYRHFHWVAADETEANHKRYLGFAAALRRAGRVRSVQTWRLGNDYDERAHTIRRLLSGPTPCAVATADASAHHVAMVALELGLRLPEDVALVGHDCHLWHASVPVPRITNLTVSHQVAAQVAIDMLCDLMTDDAEPAAPVRLDPLLLPGETTPLPDTA